MRKIQVKVNGISESIHDTELTYKVIGQDANGVDILGRHYSNYNVDMSVNYTIEDALDIEATEAIAKTARTNALANLTITHNTVAYDADGRSIGNMSAVMGIANFKYNQGCSLIERTNMESETMTLLGQLEQMLVEKQALYTAIYKSKIYWRGADDKNHSVMIESVCETLEKSMLAVATIVVR